VLGWFFIWFNTASIACPSAAGAAWIGVAASRAGLSAYALIVALMALLLWRLPGAFLPDEDQGMLNALKLPAGSTLEQTRAVTDRLSRVAMKDPQIQSVLASAGFSVTGSGQNVGMALSG
jgi:multidrug efflux pump